MIFVLGRRLFYLSLLLLFDRLQGLNKLICFALTCLEFVSAVAAVFFEFESVCSVLVVLVAQLIEYCAQEEVTEWLFRILFHKVHDRQVFLSLLDIVVKLSTRQV